MVHQKAKVMRGPKHKLISGLLPWGGSEEFPDDPEVI